MLNMGPQELVIIGVLAVVMFGKNLPDVAKKVGRAYRDFRKGLADMQAQFNLDDDPTHGTSSASHSSSYDDEYEDYDLPDTPKFEPPTSEPTVEDENV